MEELHGKLQIHLIPAGTYNIDIKDNNNCSDNVNITITEPTILVVSQTITNVSWFGVVCNSYCSIPIFYRWRKYLL